ncbi:MAG: AMP-binding protein [Magnetococcus sp. MYC-9]
MSKLLCRMLRLEVQGAEHLTGVTTGCLLIANHPGRFRQGILLAWLSLQQAGRGSEGEPLLFMVHPEAPLPRWLRLLLPALHIHVADPTEQRGAHTLASSSQWLSQHLRAGGRALVLPMALPSHAVSAARPHLKPYGWSLLAAQQAEAPVLALCCEPRNRRLGLTLLPPLQPTLPSEGELRLRRQYAAQWAQDRLGEAALAHHLGRQTLWQALCRAAHRHGRRRMLLSDATGRTARYGQLLTRAMILSRILSQQTEPGSRVGILLPGSVAATTTFFALHAIGRIPALLNFTVGAAPLRSACQTGRISVVYTSRLFVHKAGLEPLLTGLQSQCQVHFLEDVRTLLKPWQLLAGGLLALFPERSHRHLAPNSHPAQPAALLFTSGSEGEPKGVLLSHDNLLANGIQMRARIDLHAEDLLLNVLPLFHAFGLTVGTLLPILAGIRCHCLPSPLDYHHIPEVTYRTRATLLAGTDTFLAGYARCADPGDFQWMRYVVAGAEPLREETRRLWMERFGIRILEGYGTTEASPVLAVNTPLACRPGSVGRPLPGVACRLDAVPGIHDGALLSVKGPNIMLGYLLPGGEDHGCIPPSPHGEGWYASGDIVRLDEQGFLYILGRVKRFAKIAGEMISLAAVEQLAASAWPDHRHAAVALGVNQRETGGRTGEQLVLVTEHPHPNRRTLLSHLRTRGLAEIHLPGRLVSVTAIPLLGSGKIDYAAVLALLIPSPGE